jgi:hypothetical protein
VSLPPETQTGAGTLGFLIDGKVYVAITRSVQIDGTDLYSINGSDAPNKWSLAFGADSITAPGSYLINTFRLSGSPLFIAAASFQTLTDTPCAYYSNISTHTGVLEITRLDQANRIISGRFRIKLQGACGQIEITQGRFDVKF